MLTDFASLSRLDVELSGLASARRARDRSLFDTFRSRGRDTNLLYHVISGRHEYRPIGHADFVISAGQTVFIPIGERYVSQAISENSEGIYVDFRLSLAGEPVIIDEPFRVFELASAEARFVAISENLSDRLRLRAELCRLLSALSESASEGELSPEERPIRSVMLEIERHPENAPDIAELARSCRMSQTGFRERFKRLCGGYTPIAYRNKIRCERARELMDSGSFTVSQIAELLGFWDSSHLYRTLHEYENVRN